MRVTRRVPPLARARKRHAEKRSTTTLGRFLVRPLGLSFSFFAGAASSTASDAADAGEASGLQCCRRGHFGEHGLQRRNRRLHLPAAFNGSTIWPCRPPWRTGEHAARADVWDLCRPASAGGLHGRQPPRAPAEADADRDTTRCARRGESQHQAKVEPTTHGDDQLASMGCGNGGRYSTYLVALPVPCSFRPRC